MTTESLKSISFKAELLSRPWENSFFLCSPDVPCAAKERRKKIILVEEWYIYWEKMYTMIWKKLGLHVHDSVFVH